MARRIASWHVYDTRHHPPLFLHEFESADELKDYLTRTLVEFGFAVWAAYEIRPIFEEI